MHLQLRLKCESRFRSRNNKDAGKLCFSKAKKKRNNARNSVYYGCEFGGNTKKDK